MHTPEVIIFLPYASDSKGKVKRLLKISRMFIELNDTLVDNGIDSQTMCIPDWDSNVFCKFSVTCWAGGKPIKKAMFVDQIINHQKESGNRYIVIEQGYIHDRDEYYSVGLDGLNGRADFRNKNMDDSRIKRWGISLSPWKTNSDGFVLFCLQLPWDAAVCPNTDYPKYIRTTVKKILSSTSRDVVLREHPKIDFHKGEKRPINQLLLADEYAEAVEEVLSHKRVYKSKNEDIKRDFDKSWCVVTLNSNSTVEAAIYGIPSFVGDVGSMTWDTSSHNLDIENPVRPDRYQWLCDLSYSQWNEDEIIRGQPFKQLGILET